MSNPKADYKDFVRANLPTGITFDTDNVRYVVNGKNWRTYWEAKWYLDYIVKFGYVLDTAEFAYSFPLGETVAQLSDESGAENTADDGFAFYIKVKTFSTGTADNFIFLLGVTQTFGLRLFSGVLSITNAASYQTGSTVFSANDIISIFIRHDGTTTKMWTAKESESAVLESSESRSYTASNSLSGAGVLWGGYGREDAKTFDGEIFEGAYWPDHLSVSEETAIDLIEGSTTISDQTTPETWFDSKTGRNLAGAPGHWKQFGADNGQFFSGADVPTDLPAEFVVLRRPEDQTPVLYDAGAGSVYWAMYDSSTKSGEQESFRLATSPDLETWTDHSQVALQASGEATSDFIYLGDEPGTHDPFVAYYSSGGDTSNAVINVRTSSDMSTWTEDPTNPVFSNPSGPGNGIEDFRVVKMADNYWVAVFEQDNLQSDGAVALGAALNTDSLPLGSNWTKQTDQLFSSVDDEFPTDFIANPAALRDGSTYWVFYESVNFSINWPKTLARRIDFSSPSDVFDGSKYEKYGVVTFSDGGTKSFANCASMESGTMYLYTQYGPGSGSNVDDGIAKVKFDISNIREL